MKTFTKVALWILAVLVSLTMVIFGINATDVELSERARQMIQPHQGREGFHLEDFKLSGDQDPSSVRLESYQNYLEHTAELDKKVATYKKALDLYVRTISERQAQIIEHPSLMNRATFGIYRPALHQLFLIFLSQKIKQGEVNEALTLLEKSNKFVVDIARTPQTLINKMIALAELNTSADFVLNLKDAGILKKVPASLTESFKLKQSAQEIFAVYERFEGLSIYNSLKEIKEKGIDYGVLVNINGDSPEGNRAWVKFLSRNLLRVNQTTNWLADINADLLNKECYEKPIDECSETYQQIYHRWSFVNPVGVGLLNLFVPKFSGAVRKADQKINQLNEKLAKF